MDALNQAKNLIVRSQSVLILPSQEIQGDSLVSAMALYSTLKKQGKNANILVEKIPEKFQFLSGWEPEDSKDFIISIDTSKKEISKMRYEKNKKDLKIYLTVNKGGLRKGDVSFSSFDQKPNLLITIGIKSLENLGNLFEQNSRLFYETPILNIDNHPSNENFGEVNLVDVTSCSAEILTNLIKLMESEEEAFLNESVATQLLTGIICASQNFRNPKTRPRLFETSAYLIERGGDHQKIMQHLYKQKSVVQINLLGKILEKLNFDEKKELYSASLTEKDFQESQASSKDLGFVMEELKFNFRYLPNLLILWESHASPSVIKGIFYSSKTELIERILQNYEGVSKGEGVLFLVRENDLDVAREKLLKIL